MAVEPVDFRKGIYGLAALGGNALRDDPKLEIPASCERAKPQDPSRKETRICQGGKNPHPPIIWADPAFRLAMAEKRTP